MAALGLNPAQLQGVKDTWSMVEKDLKAHGIAVFIRVFKQYPDIKLLFKRMKDIPNDELAKTPTLRAHAAGFMKELSGMIEAIDEVEDLVVMIQSNATRHYKRQTTVEMYERVLVLFVVYMKDVLGDKLTADAEAGWKLVAKALIDTVAKRYEDMEKEKA